MLARPVRGGRATRTRRTFLTLSLTLLLGLGAYWLWQANPSPELITYESAGIDRGDLVQSVSANGTLNPVVLVNVGTQVSGKIQKLHADFNDRIEAGQVLAELDPALFRAALDQSRAKLAGAEAMLKLAEANAVRTRAIYDKGYVARADWDKAIQEVSTNRAEVAAALALVHRDETNLHYSVIVSPVSGIVVSRNVDVGQTVAASFQTPVLYTIAEDLKRMQIDTTVAEADVGAIRAGQTARFTVDAYEGRTFEGRVRQVRLNPQVLQNVVTYNVVIDVANADERLLPGMTAFINLIVDQRSGVVRLPVTALRYHPSGLPESEREAGDESGQDKVVYRLREGVAEAIRFTPGLNDGRWVEVLSGDLQPGDRVVVGEEEGSTPAAKKGRKRGSFRMKAF